MPVDTTEAPAEAEPTFSELTGHDRCDQCGAQAYTWVLLESGELLFCAHHWTQYKDKILPKAIKVNDQTHRLFGENRLKD